MQVEQLNVHYALKEGKYGIVPYAKLVLKFNTSNMFNIIVLKRNVCVKFGLVTFLSIYYRKMTLQQFCHVLEDTLLIN